MKKETPIWEQKGKICLNLGCGIETKKGFINVDKFYTYEELTSKKGLFKSAVIAPGAKYVQADILHLPFKDDYADYVELINCIEHLPMRGVIDYIKEIRRVMKKGAKLLIITNNMDGLALDWLNMLAHPPFNLEEFISVSETIYGNQLAEGEVHRCPFNPTFMNVVLSSAGFMDGKVFAFTKGALCPVFGSVKPYKKGAVLRNDLVVAEAVK